MKMLLLNNMFICLCPYDPKSPGETLTAGVNTFTLRWGQHCEKYGLIFAQMYIFFMHSMDCNVN